MKTIVYYVSGHGFGHAVRAAEVMRALLTRRTDWRVLIRTNVPAELFAHLPTARVAIHPAAFDAPLVETMGSLAIDTAATVAAMNGFFARWAALLADETAFLQRERPALVVADIPFVAGHAAARAGLPCVGIANFLWDWIYEPDLAKTPAGPEWLARMGEGYAHMMALLRLPFSHAMPGLKHVNEVPLVFEPPRHSREHVLRALRLPAERGLRPVFLGLRGEIPANTLAAAALEGPEYLFLYLPRHGLSGPLPGNTRLVTLGPDLTFGDVTSICETVIGKLGFSTLATIASLGCGLLYPPRAGFREDALLIEGARQFARARPLPLADFAAGAWVPHLRALHAQAPPPTLLATNGALRCAILLEEMAR